MKSLEELKAIREKNQSKVGVRSESDTPVSYTHLNCHLMHGARHVYDLRHTIQHWTAWRCK